MADGRKGSDATILEMSSGQVPFPKAALWFSLIVNAVAFGLPC